MAGGKAKDHPPIASRDVGRHNLPLQPTALLGRERERRDVRCLLLQDGVRHVTLTGPGGTGKTRLGIEVAAELAPSFRDGVFLVELAPVTDPVLVPSTIAQVLGVRETGSRPVLDALREYLRRKSILLLLDNFEQILPAAPVVADLLATSPGLTVLVTSREPLYLRGEREYAVPPLPLPAAGHRSSPTDLTSYPAVALFVERATDIRPGFAVTPENAPVIAEICTRLDGLPLAIELAAARIRLLTPEAMLARLEHRLPLLTHGNQDLPPRQRTLRDAIAWSHDLLSPCEQVLFRRLAIFVGGCTLEAAEAVALADIGDYCWMLGPDEVLEGVESLIAKNLLRRLPGNEDGVRVTTLETVREFGIEQLERAGELRELRQWHADYFLDLAEQAVPRLRGPEQAAWLDRLEAEHANLRAALAWSLDEDGQSDRALRLVGALSWFWTIRAYASEGSRWLTRALATPTSNPAARLRAHYGAGWLAHVQRDQAAARQHIEAALVLARDLDDTWAIAWSFHLLGRVAYYDGNAATARALGEQSLAAACETHDGWLISWAHHLLGLAAHIAGDYDTARDRCRTALRMREDLGYQEGLGVSLTVLGIVAWRRGDQAQAFTFTQASLRIFQEIRAYCWVHNPLAMLVGLATALQQPDRAVRLAGASAAFGESVAVPPIPLVEEILRHALATARHELGTDAYEANWEAGRGLSLDAAIAEALAVESPPSASRPGNAPPDTTTNDRPSPIDGPTAPAGLSPREIDVLRRLAAGLTSKEVADDLVLSIRTVERHITHIYEKIGARGRADATAFALKHRLL